MRKSFSAMSLMVVLFAFAIPGGSTQVPQNVSPNAKDVLAGLAFVESPASAHRLDDSELLETLDMFLAYSKGAVAVPRYKEPILTRGARGVSLFRSAAPAVALVVVGDDKQVEGLGTGAFVRGDGYVLTNWHVIAGHNTAVVFLKPAASADLKDAQAFGARVVYQDSTVDLALLKALGPIPGTLSIIPIGDMSNVQVAEDVHIIGHPHGELWSYSTGVISQIRNDYEWKYSDGSRHHARVLQMQTAINPGNSGGPVLDDSASMIGLVAMSEEGQNLNYAIAADVIQRFLRVGYAMNTRGDARVANVQPTKTFVAKSTDGKQITKLIVGSATIYWVSAPQLNDAEVYIWDGGRTFVHGQTPNKAGGFSDWSMVGAAGTLAAKSDGRIPQFFSLK